MASGAGVLRLRRVATAWFDGPMADEAHERITVDAPPARCGQIATDYERYPDWARDVKHVAVLERDGEGRGTRVEYRVAGLGKSIRYVLEYDYAQAPAAFSWQFVEGDWLRRLDGRTASSPRATARASPTTSSSTSPRRCRGSSSAARRA